MSQYAHAPHSSYDACGKNRGNTLVLNLILTGIFVLWVKKLALRSYTD